MKNLILVLSVLFLFGCKKDMSDCYIYDKSNGTVLFDNSDGNVLNRWSEVESHIATDFNGKLYGSGEVAVSCN